MWSGETRVLAAAELRQRRGRASRWSRCPRSPRPCASSMRARSCTCGSRGGVADDRRAGRQRGRHQRVLGAHHGRLVHEEVARLQAAVGRASGGCRASCSTCAPSARNASRCGSSRRRPITSPPGGGSSAAPKRASSGPATRNGRADALGQVGGRPRCVRDLVGLQARRVLPSRRSTFTPRSSSSADHRLGVADPRHVVQHDLLVGEQARGQQRQGRVLVAGGHDGAGQRHAAFDDELLHEGWRRRCRTDVGPARKLG